MWTQDLITELTRLWNEGLSTSEIGRRIGVSKNAVVGKAHRLGLDTRPSPIKRTGVARPRAEKRAAPTRPVLAPMPISAAAAPGAVQRPVSNPTPARAEPVRAEPRRAHRSAAETGEKIVALTGNKPCCWPVGDPREPGFRFCGNRALVDKPYCQEHAAIAYIPAKKKEHAA